MLEINIGELKTTLSVLIRLRNRYADNNKTNSYFAMINAYDIIKNELDLSLFKDAYLELKK